MFKSATAGKYLVDVLQFSLGIMNGLRINCFVLLHLVTNGRMILKQILNRMGGRGLN